MRAFGPGASRRGAHRRAGTRAPRRGPRHERPGGSAATAWRPLGLGGLACAAALPSPPAGAGGVPPRPAPPDAERDGTGDKGGGDPEGARHAERVRQRAHAHGADTGAAVEGHVPRGARGGVCAGLRAPEHQDQGVVLERAEPEPVAGSGEQGQDAAVRGGLGERGDAGHASRTDADIPPQVPPRAPPVAAHAGEIAADDRPGGDREECVRGAGGAERQRHEGGDAAQGAGSREEDGERADVRRVAAQLGASTASFGPLVRLLRGAPSLSRRRVLAIARGRRGAGQGEGERAGDHGEEAGGVEDPREAEVLGHPDPQRQQRHLPQPHGYPVPADRAAVVLRLHQLGDERATGYRDDAETRAAHGADRQHRVERGRERVGEGGQSEQEGASGEELTQCPPAEQSAHAELSGDGRRHGHPRRRSDAAGGGTPVRGPQRHDGEQRCVVGERADGGEQQDAEARSTNAPPGGAGGIGTGRGVGHVRGCMRRYPDASSPAGAGGGNSPAPRHAKEPPGPAGVGCSRCSTSVRPP